MRLDAIDDDGVGGLGEPSGALSCRADDGNRRVANDMRLLWAGPTKKFGLGEELTGLTAATAQSSGRAGKLRTRLRRPSRLTRLDCPPVRSLVTRPPPP